MELVIFRESKEVGRLRLSEGTFSIGRGLHNTIALDEQGVSRRHARIRVENGRVLVADLGSVNGTLLRGKHLRDETELESGDVLEIGPFFIQAILDDDFVSHEMERTESHASLKALERSARSREASAAQGEPPGPPPAGDDSSDWLAPHELFGLTEDGWIEQSPTPSGEGGDSASRTAGASDAASRAPSQPDSGEDGILLAVDDIFPPGDDDVELIELEESGDSSGPPVETEKQRETLDYDDWKTARAERATAPRLPKTPNLADQDVDAGPAAEPAARVKETPRLVAREGFAQQDQYDLDKGTCYIGRAKEMDIVLLDTNASRRHAAISREAGGFMIRDLWSLNGVEVNGERVDAALLKSGDRIRIGDTVLEFLWPAQDRTLESSDRDRLPEESVAGGTSIPAPPWPSAEGDAPPAPSSSAAEGVPSPGAAPVARGGASPLEQSQDTPQSAGAMEPSPGPRRRVERPAVRSGRSLLLSPTAIVITATLVIVVIVLLVVAFRGRPRVASHASVSPEPMLTLDSVRLVARAEAELAAGEYESALNTAILVQANQPGSRRVARLVQQVSEAWTLARLTQALENRREEIAGASPEETPVAATPVEESPIETGPPRPVAATSAPIAVVASAGAATNRGSSRADAARAVRPPPRRDAGGEVQASDRPGESATSELDLRVARWYRKGLEARDQGRYLEAVQAFEQAKAEDTLKESELYYTVEDEMKRAIEHLHGLARPLVAEASRLESEGRLTEARQKLADALSRDPYYTPAVTRLRHLEERLATEARKVLVEAQSRENEGDIAGAVEAYRSVLTLVPDPSNVYHQTATLRLEQLE